jgi:hypothetical protein
MLLLMLRPTYEDYRTEVLNLTKLNLIGGKSQALTRSANLPVPLEYS